MTAPALQRPGEPIACPTCGESKWAAEYFEAIREDVRLVRDVDGSLRVDEWLGGIERPHDARTDEECYRCLECGEELPAEAEGNKHPTVLLRRVTGILNRRDWNLDTFVAIAEILREGGFDIPEPDADNAE